MEQATQCKMLRQKVFLHFTCLLALGASLTLALPPGAPWTNFASKPVYSRALGPPSGIDTISIPYVPKSPVFPKFVDPKMFISKKTDMLSNLFGGLGPVAYNAADTKPIIPYGASGSSLETADNALFNKRDALQDGKEKIADTNGMYKRGMFGPFPKFGPMGATGVIGPQFGPITPFSSADAMADYMDKAPFSRKRRSMEAASSASDVNSISGSKLQATGISSYAKDSPIVEKLSATKSADGDAPKEYLPGMFGPFGPGGPYGPFGPFGSSASFGPGGSFGGPAVDPSAMIGKKSTFLDALFKNLATSTPATTITDAPTPKSTIVPPSFWLPSAIIPGPTEYTSKVSDFLGKLFDSIKMNATMQEASDDSDVKSDFMRSLKSDDILPDKAARSVDDVSSITAAKDAIVDAILTELGDLKGDMISTLNDLIAYEKATAAAAPAAKKPFKPFSGIFPFAKPTIDPTLPFKQRMAVLSQVFDMLTELERNITVAANSAIKTNTDTPSNPELARIPLATGAADVSSINNTLLDAILNRIAAAQTASPVSYPASFIKESPMMSRAMPQGPTSFWVSYPESSASVIKRQVPYDSPYLGYEYDNDQRDHRQYTRGVQMQMHQGYQSLPAGSVESVQAGGGSTPEHQGGGIKLLGQSNAYGNLNKWADWVQYHKNEYEDSRHHHNHH
ncbi:uncharacterized protein LOC105280933 isoform X2 [Ooceraea biroi]|uniref:Uncharacterized protein n=1 Tax=Ooceraea biroi TaxID=2015173 RepID=A0A026WAM7_OOCBI|nr:uncharacterized protein LOC105280933 isoform X2 [Ooceraea biroi]EZA53132.1 hypothetical protein X777_06210 [Ooceraea biroi]